MLSLVLVMRMGVIGHRKSAIDLGRTTKCEKWHLWFRHHSTPKKMMAGEETEGVCRQFFVKRCLGRAQLERFLKNPPTDRPADWFSP